MKSAPETEFIASVLPFGLFQYLNKPVVLVTVKGVIIFITGLTKFNETGSLSIGFGLKFESILQDHVFRQMIDCFLFASGSVFGVTSNLPIFLFFFFPEGNNLKISPPPKLCQKPDENTHSRTNVQFQERCVFRTFL